MRALVAAVFILIATSALAGFGIFSLNGGTPATPSLTGITLSNSTFTCGTAGTVGAVTVQGTGSIGAATLSLTGTDAAQFSLSSTTVPSNLTVGTSPSGCPRSYSLNIVATLAGATGSPFTQAITPVGSSPSSAEKPGISAALFSAPYYTCTTNYYVGDFGAGTPNDSNNGTAQSTPWATLSHAGTVNVSGTGSGSWCVNVAPGTYTAGPGTANGLQFGGTTASQTGYVVWRCTGNGNETNTPANQCKVTDSGNPFCGGVQNGCSSPAVYKNYIVIDNFFLSAASPQQPNAVGISCYNGDVGPTAPGCHHWIMVNNIITGYGLSGIQYNNTEYGYALHNVIFANAQNNGCSGGAQGSGISYGSALPISSYTQTTDDTGAGANSSKLGIYFNGSPNNHVHDIIAYNVVYTNHIVGCAGDSDGNGIILDSFDEISGSTGVNYGTTGNLQPNYTLIAFNVVYNNGGRGVAVSSSGQAIIANNTLFNHVIDPAWGGSGWPGMEVQRCGQGISTPGNVIVLNNMIYQKNPGANPLGFNVGNSNAGCTSPDAFFNGAGTSGCPTIDGATDCGGNNMTYIGTFSGSACSENTSFNGNVTWTNTHNKCRSDLAAVGDMRWAKVDSTDGNTGSAGTMDIQPTGTNFALCTASATPDASCTGASAAVGYVGTRGYLPAWVEDAGACDRSFTSCP